MNALRNFITIGLLVVLPGIASATIITASDTGWYNNSGYHNPSVDNYLVGDAADTEYRNWMTFDLGGIGSVSSAVLRAYMYDSSGRLTGYSSNDEFETWSLWDLSTDITDLAAGTAGLEAFTDIGSGTVYGSVDVSYSDIGQFVEVTLNAEALASLSASSGLWGIGGSITTLDSENEMLFGWSHLDNQVELVINEAVSVPEPATLALLGLGLAAIGFSRKKRTD